VLHAPRQTGKTSVVLALRDLLNAGGDHRCLYVNVEAAQAARENVAEAMRVTLYQLASEEQATLGSRTLADIWPGRPARRRPPRRVASIAGALVLGRPDAAGAAD